MKGSKIEWCDHAFNPWIGCTKVSPGCLHCYAETMNKRMGWAEWGRGGARKRTSEAYWKQPLKWNEECRKLGIRQRVFCASLADVFDEEVKGDWRADLMELIDATKELDWLLLTKRPENILPLMQDISHDYGEGWNFWRDMPNVWLGVSAEDQKRWDERVPVLLATPAIRHFVSAEPLLGPIDLGPMHPDWVIVGGESGPGARPMRPEWVRDIRDQCEGWTKFFFKQWGGVRKKEAGRELDGRTWDEIPIVKGR